MKKQNCLIIAEAGVNHNGSLEEAMNLVKIASESGADFVKFQTFNSSELVSSSAKKAKYQDQENNYKNQLEMLKDLELSENEFKKIHQYCKELNIGFLSTPFDFDSAKMLINIGMDFIKIPSGEITNKTFLEDLVKLNKKMILSTGMSNLEDVRLSINWINNARKKRGFKTPLNKVLTILHCTSCYPAPNNSLNLRVINTLKDIFKLPVGYSDHSSGIDAAIIAVSLGAKVIEKHFTSNKDQVGPDHKASLDPDELKKMIQKIRECEIMLGSPIKKPTPYELEIRSVARRSICIKGDLNKGDLITKNNIFFKRPGKGIQPKDIDQIIGKVLKKNKKKGSILKWSDIL